ncbi:MAG: exopolyphosphatase / guanosine-5-triphosphate,3-diphosphate pyrophosphatase [Actinomycetota bacterium]|jgi:exopolyphosphatase/guanosine-5'-triphosphate,3'-diphosphate pyrophosphatase|nr:exopolyphosphatase / guanosine-5-triphosphate,3-diphosphate pyrophosphatase [Actinomycetota bacterium]
MTRVAAVDMGTNSTRLLVADVDGRGRDAKLVTVERRTQITRLGQGVDRDRTLHPDAIERTLAALREYRTVTDELGAERIRATATSAARDARNRDDLFDPVEQVLGARPELLAGDDEARLEFIGATAGLTEPSPYLVVDVGGGSTEFIVGTDEPEALTSIDVGCVRLTEQFLHSDPPTAEELSQAVSVVRDQLADVGRLFPAMLSAPTLIGTAGTVWTLAAIELGVDAGRSDLIDHFRLTRAAAEDVFRTLATEPVEQRRHNPGLEAGRVDVIVGGAIVVVSAMRQWGYDSLLVSEADILDGLARDSV